MNNITHEAYEKFLLEEMKEKLTEFLNAVTSYPNEYHEMKFHKYTLPCQIEQMLRDEGFDVQFENENGWQHDTNSSCQKDTLLFDLYTDRYYGERELHYTPEENR